MKKSLPSKINNEPIFFCCRENETKLIHKRIKNNNNIIIISPDGVGKTSLINHSLNHLKKDNYFNTQVIDLSFFPSFRKFLMFYIECLSDLALYHKNFDVNKMGKEESLSEIDLLKILNQLFSTVIKEKKKIVIVFDNVQYSYHYGADKFENSILNPIIHSENIVFILSGTKKTYSLDKTHELYLKKIDGKEYHKFAMNILSKKGIRLSKKALSKAIKWSYGEISAMDSIYTRIYNMHKHKVKEREINTIIYRVMAEVTRGFAHIKDLLSPYQWKLLITIAVQDDPYQITSSSFIAEHELNAPSSVKTALDALVEKGLIFKNEKNYELSNGLFKNWIIHNSQIK